jgi:hypothetical protein
MDSSALPVSRLPAVAIAPTTITETDADRQAALERVKSTLLLSKPLPGPAASPLGLGGPAAAGVARRATARGRRTTTYTPVIPDDVPLAKLLEQQRTRETSAASEAGGMSPFSGVAAAPFPSPSRMNSFGGDRTNSILSTTSNSTVSNRIDPFESSTTPGLRASIVETVNVLIKGGEVSRVMITGEISLSHRPEEGTAAPRIRIANFEQFEKTAPNAAYLTPIPSSPGEYTVTPSLSFHTALVLKYQLRVPTGSEHEFVPLDVRATWKCEATQTRVMVLYTPTSGGRLEGGGGEASPFGEESTTLEGVEFHIPLSVIATSFQAKPTASYIPERNRLSFVVEPIVLEKGAEGKKLLASVETLSAAVPQPIAIRWRVKGKSVSKVGVEVEGTKVETVRETVAGKYLIAP